RVVAGSSPACGVFLYIYLKSRGLITQLSGLFFAVNLLNMEGESGFVNVIAIYLSSFNYGELFIITKKRD
ncbi:hypothetical protein VXN63_11960, partial [Marinilactibacillus sp. XAAS-LB27]|uniref:hypothetical protein n=1 Tax=Marinilactibacillus sp. XAAS-LB27 TaxID=3114538 RepID=UPI002E171FB1|nr:hypothetical protein [Marinilactibacillus sp. XAAS-LB27]